MNITGIMKLLQNLAQKSWDKLLVAVGVLCVLLPISPMNMYYTQRDSGVFLYIGWRILNGELPYRDIWDHKPPVIFYINALGLAITDGSRWGVWLLEFLGLWVAALVGYKLIQKAVGTIPAVLSTFLWLLTLVFVIGGGNFTTEYTLPLQFVTLWLVTDGFEKTRPILYHWRWFLIGLIGATAFFTKQTVIGIWLSIILFLIIHRVRLQQFKELFLEGLCFFGGVGVECIIWVAFFGLQGGLAQFWSAAFAYNFIYSSSITSFVERLSPVIIGIAPLTTSGLLQFAGIGYLIGLFSVCFRRDIVRGWLPLLVIGLFDLPIELILISTSGKTYPHYYMTALPVLALFTGITFWAILSSNFLYELPPIRKYALVLGICGVFLWASFSPYRAQAISLRRDVNVQHSIVRKIERITNSKDKVLIWGAEASINYFSHRQSPTRFVYQYPLYTQGYVNEQMIVEFLEDLIRESPQLIVDTHNPKTPIYEFPLQTDAIQQRVAYLQCHYRIVDEIQDWIVYEYTAGNCSP